MDVRTHNHIASNNTERKMFKNDGRYCTVIRKNAAYSCKYEKGTKTKLNLNQLCLY